MFYTLLDATVETNTVCAAVLYQNSKLKRKQLVLLQLTLQIPRVNAAEWIADITLNLVASINICVVTTYSTARSQKSVCCTGSENKVLLFLP